MNLSRDIYTLCVHFSFQYLKNYNKLHTTEMIKILFYTSEINKTEHYIYTKNLCKLTRCIKHNNKVFSLINICKKFFMALHFKGVNHIPCIDIDSGME